ncbi:MAG: tripartite tricarboxylate transporter permease [Candidatus Methylomirabilales bacterium]
MADFLLGTTKLFGDPVAVLYFFGGLVGGLIFGAIPGVSMITLAALVLPFTFYMTPERAIMLFGVIYCSGVFGGAITAILFNIPGAPENAPTAFDGYPMTQQGKAGKAIGAAILCSALGGLLSAAVMMAATPVIARAAITYVGPQEIFTLIFFGLAVVAMVGSGSLIKGWLSVLLGLLIATVGIDPAGGLPRFAFGSYYLLAGIHFVPLILGFFAASEVFIQSERLVMHAYTAPRISVDLPSLLEFWRLKWCILRSFVLGFFAGVLPGIGATLAAFLSYSEARRWSRHPERFGTGELEGVVASETANNAATGGAMIPLLALGLPGGALTAIMMSAFMIHGMEPGPLIMMRAKDLVWLTFVAMFYANLGIFLLGYLETKVIVHLLRIPFKVFAPTILVLATIGTYALRNLILDVWVMYAAGIAGYFLRRSGYSVPGIVVGVILGQLGESAFVKAMQIMHYDLLGFFRRPICAFLLLATLATVVINVVRAVRKSDALPSPANVDAAEQVK